MEQRWISYLMINAHYPELNPFHLSLDDEQGWYLAAHHLIKLGHRKVAGIFKNDDMQGIYRIKGFIRAFREANLNVYPEMLITFKTEDKYTTPQNKMTKLFNEKNSPTAIVCYNDQLALNILNVIRKVGLVVPEDISISLVLMIHI
jgi:GntR family transcriptional regulator of arabinose operon